MMQRNVVPGLGAKSWNKLWLLMDSQISEINICSNAHDSAFWTASKEIPQ